MHVRKLQQHLLQLTNQLYWLEQLWQCRLQYVTLTTTVLLLLMDQQVEQEHTNIASMVPHGNHRIHLVT